MSDFIKDKLAKESIKTGSSYLEFLTKHTKESDLDHKILFKTNDEKMLKIQDIMKQVSKTCLPVMICGEQGVGKRFLAKIIHQISTDKEHQLANVDCVNTNVSSFEEKIFSLYRGEEGTSGNGISRGSLILDDVSNLEETLQLKLLNMMKEKKIAHSKTNMVMPFDFRVISMTKNNLSEEIEKGRLKKELYYRLYVVMITVPPLRERTCDIEILAKEFVNHYCKIANKKTMQLSSGALKKLMAYSWPENVSELKKVVKKAVMLNMTNEIESEHISLKKMATDLNADWATHLPVGKTIKLVETHFILKTLEYHNGNRTHTSKTLGISLRTLRNKLNEFTSAGFCVPMSLRQKT